MRMKLPVSLHSAIHLAARDQPAIAAKIRIGSADPLNWHPKRFLLGGTRRLRCLQIIKSGDNVASRSDRMSWYVPIDGDRTVELECRQPDFVLRQRIGRDQ